MSSLLGRSGAFERIYRRYAPDVYRYALAILHDPSDAEDVTQITFLNAYRALERGERPDKPRHWLIAIAHNVCRQRFRQESRRPQEVEFDEALAAAAPTDAGPSAEEIGAALGPHLRTCSDCARLARRLRAQRSTLRGLQFPLPDSLATWALHSTAGGG